MFEKHVIKIYAMENSTSISNIDVTSPSDKNTEAENKGEKKVNLNVNRLLDVETILEHIETQTIENKEDETKQRKKIKLESEKSSELKKNSKRSKKIIETEQEKIKHDQRRIRKNEAKIIQKKDLKKKNLIKLRGRWGKHIPSFIEPIKLLPSNNVLLNIPNELKIFQKHLPVSNLYGFRYWGNIYPKYIEPFSNRVIYSFDKKTFYFSDDNVYQFKTEVLSLVICGKRVFFILEDCFYKYEGRKFIKFNIKIQHLCVNENHELVLVKDKKIYSKSCRKTLKVKSPIKRIFPTTEINKYYLILENNHIIYFDKEIHYLFKIYSEIYRIQCINNDLILLTKDGIYIYYGDQKRGTFLRRKYFMKSTNSVLFTANNDFIFINNLSANHLIIFSKSDLSKYTNIFYHPTILNILISENVIYTLFHDSVKRNHIDKLHLLKKQEDLKGNCFIKGLFDPISIFKKEGVIFKSTKYDKEGVILMDRAKFKANMYMFSTLTQYLEELDYAETKKQKQKQEDILPKSLCLENIDTQFHKYFKEEVKPIEIRQFIDETAEQKEIKDEVEKKVIKRKRGF